MTSPEPPPIRIPLTPIESSSLAAIGYDAERLIFAVQFKNGDIFHYGSFGIADAIAFDLAESKGKFYAAQIKGRFPGMKMTGHCPNCGDKAGWIGERCTDCGTASYIDAPREDTHGSTHDEHPATEAEGREPRGDAARTPRTEG